MLFLLLLLSWQVAWRWSNQALHNAHLKTDNMLKEKEDELVAGSFEWRVESGKNSHGYSKDSCDKCKGFGKVGAKSDGRSRSWPYPSTPASIHRQSSVSYLEAEEHIK